MDNRISQSFEAESPWSRSRYWQGQYLVRPATSFTAASLLKWLNGRGAFWGLFYNGSNAIPEGFALVTYAPTKGPTSKCYRLEG